MTKIMVLPPRNNYTIVADAGSMGWQASTALVRYSRN